jgi:glycosyltransferase involved in cell wall biosynthesis
MTIGACLIVKNEKELLPRCLESLKGFDAIFIADTGSIDNTVEVAKKYTDNVYTDYKWEDSFCKARNFIREKATTDWILSIDADEILHDVGAVKEAVSLAEARGSVAVDCKLIAEDNGQFFMFPRLFKNSPQCWWNGNIHNHLSVLGDTIGDVRITHTYSPAHALDPDRAIRILEKEVAEHSGPREMFYLGREYYYRGMYDKAVVVFGKYVQLSKYLSEKADAFLLMARCYWEMHLSDDARDACAQALIINANFREAILFMATLSWPHNAEQWKRMAETANNRDVLFVRN